MGNGRVKQLKKIAADALKDDVTALINGRCDRIEAYVKDYLTRTESREKLIRTWLVNEVKGKIQNDLFNANCTIDAVVEVLAEAGINIPEFAAKVDAKKLAIRERKLKEADEAMKAEMEKRAAEAKAAQEPAAPEAKPEGAA
jgi:hypothetical protein